MLRCFPKDRFGYTVFACFALLMTGCSQHPTAEPSVKAVSVQNVSVIEAEIQRRLSAGDFAGAVPPLKQLVRLQPDTPDLLEVLGMAVVRSGKARSFLEEARAELRNDPNDLAALTVAANALPGKDNEKERLALIRRLVALRSNNNGARLLLAQELVNTHLHNEARPLLDQLISSTPDDPLPYYLRGKSAFYQARTPDDYRSAESDLKAALTRKPDFGWANLYLAKVYLAQKKPTEAVAALKTAETRMPQNPEVLFDLARAYRTAGNVPKAAETESRFRALKNLELETVTLVTRCDAFPDDFNLQLKAASLLIKTGDIDRAGIYLRRTLALKPDDPRVGALREQFERLLTARSVR